ncbi:MAG: hypothetical protein RDA78_14410 [Roseibium sp.]|uniref:class I SAM-dependent methyltransferase n=1 Tax=Roseibium sp. TaxID=1936156 RepID=UPI003D9C41AE
MTTRNQELRRFAHDANRALEIGALASPVLRDLGARVRYIDHCTTEELRKKYAGVSKNICENLVDVDYVWVSGPIDQVLTDWSDVDLIAASHVIEHVPDIVGWLRELGKIMSETGRISLAIPEKTRIFDLARAPSTLGDVLEAFYAKRKEPSLRQVIDHRRYGGRINGLNFWQHEAKPEELEPLISDVNQLSTFIERYHTGEYIDTHCWVFTIESFRSIIEDLNRLKYLDYKIEGVPQVFGHEFIVHLKRH